MNKQTERKRNLVLGCRGQADRAWLSGLTSKLIQEGAQIHAAELIVGTSAGSKVGARTLLLLFWICVAWAGSPAQAATPTAGDLISAKPFKAPATIKADARLLIHYMPSIAGNMIRASTLLFVPHKKPPTDGWPVVAWAHGTTTAGQKLCAPSLSPMLDGGLTQDGFITNYVFVIQSLVEAGYAVVAPDLEGLGAVASAPQPYYSAASLARSLIAGVRAARHADAQISPRWAAVGHSDGGHGVLFVEAHAAEAPELTFKGTVAFAPYTSVAAIVALLGDRTVRDPQKVLDYVTQQNFNVGLMAAGIQAQSPAFDLNTIMGTDLRQLMSIFKTKGSVKITRAVTQAIKTKTPVAFLGFKQNWDTVPAMRAFLAVNDPAVTPGFTLRLPTLVVQGTKDASVPEPLTTAFTAKLLAVGAPVSYRTYTGADHFTIIPQAMPKVLAFLFKHLR